MTRAADLEALDTDGQGRVAEDNEIVNCTFYDSRHVLFRTNPSPGSNNRFVNCLFDTITSAEVYDDATTGFSYDHTNFSNLGFPAPDGTDITTFAPDFVDSVDFIPQNVELKAGIPTGVKYDKRQRERDAVHPTLGANEID